MLGLMIAKLSQLSISEVPGVLQIQKTMDVQFLYIQMVQHLHIIYIYPVNLYSTYVTQWHINNIQILIILYYLVNNDKKYFYMSNTNAILGLFLTHSC